MMNAPVLRSACLGLSVAVLSFSVAHAVGPPTLVSASPAKDSYTAWPKQIRLTFDQPLSTTGLQLQLFDPDGRRTLLSRPVVSKSGITVPTPATTFPVHGPYMLSWQGRTASGEDVNGAYSFFVQ